MQSQSLIVFDMDGVLIDVSESYRDTIRQTARLFFKGARAWEKLPDPLFVFNHQDCGIQVPFLLHRRHRIHRSSWIHPVYYQNSLFLQGELHVNTPGQLVECCCCPHVVIAITRSTLL